VVFFFFFVSVSYTSIMVFFFFFFFFISNDFFWYICAGAGMSCLAGYGITELVWWRLTDDPHFYSCGFPPYIAHWPPILSIGRLLAKKHSVVITPNVET